MRTTMQRACAVLATAWILAGSSMPVAAFADDKADDALVARVQAGIVRDKLAANPDCIAFVVTRNSDPGVDRVDVQEVHDKKCGGDPQIAHHLFSVYVDQKTNQMASDAGDPVDGTLKPMVQ